MSRNVLSPRKVAFVSALAAGKSNADAAAAIGITPRQASRYLADDRVAAALKEAQASAREAATRRLTAGIDKAIGVLETMVDGADVADSIRLRAAVAWLEQGRRSLELDEFAARLEAVEAAVDAKRA